MCVIIGQKYPISVALSQHSSAISSLIVADWPLHYIIQNFKRFFSPSLKFQRRSVRHLPLGRTQLTIGRCVCRCVKSRRLPVDRRRSTMTSTTGQLLAISTPPPHNNICLDELRSCRAGSLSPLPPTTHNGRSHSRASINA